jgi:hypothetical protein
LLRKEKDAEKEKRERRQKKNQRNNIYLGLFIHGFLNDHVNILKQRVKPRISQDSWYLGRDSKRALPESKSGARENKKCRGEKVATKRKHNIMRRGRRTAELRCPGQEISNQCVRPLDQMIFVEADITVELEWHPARLFTRQGPNTQGSQDVDGREYDNRPLMPALGRSFDRLQRSRYVR